MNQAKFGFEDLEVWQKAVEFAETTLGLISKLKIERKHYRLIEQLESASASIALNIAEGKDRYSKKEFIQFLYVARGSLYETITLLIIFHKNTWINQEEFYIIKNTSYEINKMLCGLINSIKNSIY